MGALNLEPLEKALSQLGLGLDASQAHPENELMRDGVIQRFEYSIDLCWKLLQRYLKTVAQLDESVLRTKKDLFREGAKRGLLDDAEKWIGYYEARNEVSHSYNASSAASIYDAAILFYGDAAALLAELKKC